MARRNRVIFYCIILMLFCQVLPVSAVTEEQKNVVKERCDTVKESLKKVQREDARVRVYLGGYYETVLSRFIMPLNVRLVENNLPSANLVENQNRFSSTRDVFSNDFVSYQKALEELVLMDCKNEPEKFYDKLTTVRQKRKVMSQDVLKMRNLISEHVKLVRQLEDKL